MAPLYPHNRRHWIQRSRTRAPSSNRPAAWQVAGHRRARGPRGARASVIVAVPSLALAAQVSTQLDGLGDVLKIDSDTDGTTDFQRIAGDIETADIVL